MITSTFDGSFGSIVGWWNRWSSDSRFGCNELGIARSTTLTTTAGTTKNTKNLVTTCRTWPTCFFRTISHFLEPKIGGKNLWRTVGNAKSMIQKSIRRRVRNGKKWRENVEKSLGN